MAVVVGTDVYLSVADADTYWSNRNNAVWAAATTANKEKALREATQYLDGTYSFIGDMTVTTQALAWPRLGAIIKSGNFKNRHIESNIIPQQIKDACAELALEALTARLDPVNDDVISSVKIDVIEVDYAEFAPSQKTFTFVRKLLNGLIYGSPSNAKLVRV